MKSVSDLYELLAFPDLNSAMRRWLMLHCFTFESSPGDNLERFVCVRCDGWLTINWHRETVWPGRALIEGQCGVMFNRSRVEVVSAALQ